MGIVNTKHEQPYDELVYLLDTLTYGWDTPSECHSLFIIHAELITDNVSKLVQEKPELIINVIKIYPQVKEHLFDILGTDKFRHVSNQLGLYYL